MTKYGQTIKWTEFPDLWYKTTVNGCNTLEEARTSALRSAKKMGWTYPKWYQFWRWNDTKADWMKHE